MDSRDYIPYISLRPSRLSMYYLPEKKGVKSDKQAVNELNLKDNKPEGLISFKAEKRIRDAIDWLLELSPEQTFYDAHSKKNRKFRINFITLTLSSKQIHDDNTIKRQLLNHFLQMARAKWKVRHYLWRAESQKNGNIHFHITTNRYIPHQELKEVWNKIQNKLGYVDRFQAKYRNRQPNSTDVHSVRKVRNLSQYLAKYCTKQEKYRKLVGKIWGLSTSLSRLRSRIIMATNKALEELESIGALAGAVVKQYDYAVVVYHHVRDWCTKVKGVLYDEYITHMLEYRNCNARGEPMPLFSEVVLPVAIPKKVVPYGQQYCLDFKT